MAPHNSAFFRGSLGFRFGETCKRQKDKGFPGASISPLPQVGLWADRPTNLSQCLIFVTRDYYQHRVHIHRLSGSR
jgi:hypothetical protein